MIKLPYMLCIMAVMPAYSVQQSTPQENNTTAPISGPPVPAAIAPGTPLILDFSTDGEPRRPRIIGRTNLPDGAQLGVMLVRKEIKFMAQAPAVVSGGRFVAGPIGPEAGLAPGAYMLSVSAPLSQIQPPQVQRLVGVDYENLTGPYFDDSGLGRSVDREITYRVPGNDSPRARAAALAAREADLKSWARNSCASVESMQGRATLTPKATAKIEACVKRTLAP